MLKRKAHRLILLAIDALFIAVALGLAYLIRRDFRLEQEYRIQYIHILPFILFVRILFLYLFKLYRGMLRYASINELIAIVVSSTLGTLVFILANVILEIMPRLAFMPIHPSGASVLRVPWGVVIIEWLLVILMIGGGRFSRRVILTFGQRAMKNARRVLILGAGDTGETIARQLMNDPDVNYRPVCFLDDDPFLRDKHIHHLPVAGNLDDLPDAVERYNIDDVIIAIPVLKPARISEMISACKKSPVTFRIAPGVQDLMDGSIEVSKIRRVDIEDLLGREPILLSIPEEKNYIRDETVLVTGAGGSIGTELCRQLMSHQPRRIILLGKGENSIFEIATELNCRFREDRVIPVIADVAEKERLGQVFREYQPGICFHAVAHKHVPLMEMHPGEAVRNNIIGTLNMAVLADEHAVKIFVMISTDKAVDPTNVMGATKRIGELIIFSLAGRSSTAFLAVRFGNVLGSRGSVVPLFKKQIERGGPVTVTHPDVVRYFMTIPEAVSLVLQTGAMRDFGSLFLLDMGEPVRILDLARNLITLSGLEPDADIPIVFTGLRPGEKLREELLTGGEGIQKTDMGKIFVTRAEGCDWDRLMAGIEELRKFSQAGDPGSIRRVLKSLVPEYSYEIRDNASL